MSGLNTIAAVESRRLRDLLAPASAWNWLEKRRVSVSLPPGTVAVRLCADNPIELPLHVGAVELFDARFATLGPPAIRRVSASSVWGARAGRHNCAVEQLVTPYVGPGIHTDLETSPCIEMQFVPSAGVAGLTVFGRRDLWAWRNNWMQVWTKSASARRWVKIFDCVEELEVLLSSERVADARCSPEENVVRKVVGDLVRCLVLGQEPSAMDRSQAHALWSPDFDALLKGTGRARVYGLEKELGLLNWAAAPNGVEWTSHGFQRSFRFWSREAKAKCLSVIADVCQALSDAGLPCFVAYGTLLGIHRAGDFIDHDDDCDVQVVLGDDASKSLSELLSQGVTRLDEAVARCGLQSVRFQNHLKVSLEWCGYKINVDLFPSVYRDGHLQSAVVTPKPIRIASDNVVWKEFRHVTLPFPSDCDAYCDAVYGVDWRKPVSYMEHVWHQ